MSVQRWAFAALTVLAGLYSGMGACSTNVPLKFDSPAMGSFHELSSPTPGSPSDDVLVTGKFRYEGLAAADAVVELYVNGILGSPIQATVHDTNPVTFSAAVPIDYRVPGADAEPHLNTVIAVLTDSTNNAFQRRAHVTLVVGEDPGEQWNASTENGIALRLAQPGLDAIADFVAPTVTGSLDLTALEGTSFGGLCFPEIDPTQDCVTEGGLPIDVFVETVTHGEPSVDITPSAGVTHLGVALPALEVDFKLHDPFTPPGAPLIYCEGTVTIDPLMVDAQLDQTPASPQIDVTQTNLAVAFGTFTVDFTLGPCAYSTFEAYLVGTLGADFEASALTLVADSLNPPGGGSVIADAVEAEINALGIAQAIEPTLMMDLNSSIVAIDEDVDGIRYMVDTAAVANDTLCAQGQLFDGACPALPPERFRVPVSPPVWGALSPGALPFDLGIGLSDSFMNQLFAGFVETGGLSGEITEDPSCDDGTPTGSPTLTGACLFGTIPPELQNDIAPTDAMSIRYSPTAAPILTGSAGPLTSQSALQLAGMVMELRRGPALLVRGILRLNGGISAVIDDPYAGGVIYPPGFVPDTKLEFDIETCSGTPTCAPDASFTTIEAYLTTPLAQWIPPTALVDLFIANGSFLEQEILPKLTNAIAAFDLPTLLGFGLGPVESVRDQGFTGLFLELVPAEEDNGTN